MTCLADPKGSMWVTYRYAVVELGLSHNTVCHLPSVTVYAPNGVKWTAFQVDLATAECLRKRGVEPLEQNADLPSNPVGEKEVTAGLKHNLDTIIRLLNGYDAHQGRVFMRLRHGGNTHLTELLYPDSLVDWWNQCGLRITWEFNYYDGQDQIILDVEEERDRSDAP